MPYLIPDSSMFDRFVEALTIPASCLHGKEGITVVVDPGSQETDDDLQTFAKAFDWSQEAHAAWLDEKEKAATAEKILANPDLKLLIDYLHGEIKAAVPAYTIPDATKLETDLAAKARP